MDGTRVRTQIDLAAVPEVRPRQAERQLSRPVAAFAGLLGPVVAAVSIVLEPAPADPDAATSAIGTLVALALMGSWIMAGIHASLRRSQALTWAVAAAAMSLAMTVGCPISGHHTVGGWWFAQLGVSIAALGAAGTLYTRRT